MSVPFIWYAYATESDEGFFLNLTDKHGWFHRPLSRSPVCEIGDFRWDLPPDHFQRLWSEISKAGLGLHGAEFPAGDLVTEVGMFEPGPKTVAMHSFISGEPPAYLDGVLQEVEITIAEIAPHPHRAVKGTAGWDGPSVKVGQDLRFSLTIRNIGSQPGTVANPAGAATVQEEGMVLVLYRVREAGREYFKNIDLIPGDARMKAPPGEPPPPAGTRMRLEPDHSLELVVQKQVRLAPDKYEAFVRYTSAKPADADETFVGGTLEVDLGPLRIEE